MVLWSALKFPGRCGIGFALWTQLFKHHQHQKMTWHPKSSQTAETLNTKLFLQTLSSCSVLFLLSSIKVVLLLSLVHDCHFFLKVDGCCCSWCSDTRLSPLFVKLSALLNRLCLTVLSKLLMSYMLVCFFMLVHHIFSLLVNFSINMLRYSTLWTARLFSNDLWLSLLVVSIIFIQTAVRWAVNPMVMFVCTDTD